MHLYQAGGRGKELRAIGGRRLLEERSEALEQHGEIAAGERQCGQTVGGDAGEAQFLEGTRQCARKAGRVGDGAEVAQRALTDRVEGGAGGHGLGAKPRAGRATAACQRHDRRPRRQLRQAEALDAERGAAAGRDAAREVVGGAAGGRDNRDARAWRTGAHRCHSTFEPLRGRRGDAYRERAHVRRSRSKGLMMKTRGERS